MAGNGNTNVRNDQNNRRKERRIMIQMLFVVNAVSFVLLMTPAWQWVIEFIAWAFSPEWKGTVMGFTGALLLLGQGIGWVLARMGD